MNLHLATSVDTPNLGRTLSALWSVLSRSWHSSPAVGNDIPAASINQAQVVRNVQPAKDPRHVQYTRSEGLQLQDSRMERAMYRL